jgi:uncharacterized protein YukE
MSGGEIVVDAAVMEDISRRIQAAANMFLQEIDKQRNAVTSMTSSSYKGKAAAAYGRVFDDLHRDFSKFVNGEIHGIAQLLKGHANKWVEMDGGLVV